MVFWGPAVFFRPFPCHPPYTREVGVPIRRLKILAKFALVRGGRRWRWLSCGPPCLDLGPVLGWAIIKWVGMMHPTSIFAQTPRLVPCPLASRSATPHSASRRPPCRPPTNPQHDAKKARMKETRLGEKCRGDSHAEGGGACPRPTEKKYDPSPPSCSSGAGLPRPRHAQCTSRNSALTSHVARVVAMDPCPRCFV